MNLTLSPSHRIYLGTVTDVHDGDTITIDTPLVTTSRVDQYLGFGCRIEHGRVIAKAHLRFYGINAPELATPAGPPARDFLVGLLASKKVLVRAWQAAGHDVTEKYGRTLADIWADTLAGPSVNERMITAGHAIPYFG